MGRATGVGGAMGWAGILSGRGYWVGRPTGIGVAIR